MLFWPFTLENGTSRTLVCGSKHILMVKSIFSKMRSLYINYPVHFFSFILVCEPTGLVIQCDHSVFVDFGHIVDDVLWIHITMV